MLENSFSWIHQFCPFFANFQKSMKSYIPAFLWISLEKHLVPASCIPHFKGLGMRNLQYEIGNCQKHHIKVTMTMSSYFFANFVNFQKSMKSYYLAFLWIALDRIIVWTPIIPHWHEKYAIWSKNLSKNS